MYRTKSIVAALMLTAMLAVDAGQPARATQLIINGGFETGDFTGWSRVALGVGAFTVESGTTTPLSVFDTVGPASGTFYAVSDQDDSGTHALLQSFTVAPGASSVVLSFRMFVNNAAGVDIVDSSGLNHTIALNQHARVDLLTGTAAALDTGAGVLANFYLGSDLGTNPAPYSDYVFDITALTAAGGTFQIRFADTVNLFVLNLGVDDVSVIATQVPSPESLLLLAFGAGLVAHARRRLR